jgi:hypothetical protein
VLLGKTVNKNSDEGVHSLVFYLCFILKDVKLFSNERVPILFKFRLCSFSNYISLQPHLGLGNVEAVNGPIAALNTCRREELVVVVAFQETCGRAYVFFLHIELSPGDLLGVDLELIGHPDSH